MGGPAVPKEGLHKHHFSKMVGNKQMEQVATSCGESKLNTAGPHKLQKGPCFKNFPNLLIIGTWHHLLGI